MTRTTTAAVAALTVLALAGCEGVTGPSAESARVRATVQGDDAAAQPAASPEEGAPAGSEGTDGGEVRVSARVFVWSEAEGWVEVTRGAAEQTVRASGADGARPLAEAEVEAGVYRRVRVEFTRVEADASTELRVGTGLVGGTVRVDAGGEGGVVVEREIRLDASARSSAELRIDLNAEQWMGRADAATGAVAEADFRGAVQVVVR